MSATFATKGRSSRPKLSERFQLSPSLYNREIVTLCRTPVSVSLAQIAAFILPRRISCTGFGRASAFAGLPEKFPFAMNKNLPFFKGRNGIETGSEHTDPGRSRGQGKKTSCLFVCVGSVASVSEFAG